MSKKGGRKCRFFATPLFTFDKLPSYGGTNHEKRHL